MDEGWRMGRLDGWMDWGEIMSEEQVEWSFFFLCNTRH